MSDDYTFVHHLDAPKRIYGLSLDELVIVVMSLALLLLSNHKLTAVLLGYSLLSGLRALKKGRSPRHLLVLGYWYLSYSVMQCLLSALPASHQRLWVV